MVMGINFLVNVISPTIQLYVKLTVPLVFCNRPISVILSESSRDKEPLLRAKLFVIIEMTIFDERYNINVCLVLPRYKFSVDEADYDQA